MAQLNFAAITNHLHSIGNKVNLVLNMIPIAGFAAVQQQIDTNHLQIVALFFQAQGQIGQIQNECIFTDLRLAS